MVFEGVSSSQDVSKKLEECFQWVSRVFERNKGVFRKSQDVSSMF